MSKSDPARRIGRRKRKLVLRYIKELKAPDSPKAMMWKDIQEIRRVFDFS